MADYLVVVKKLLHEVNIGAMNTTEESVGLLGNGQKFEYLFSSNKERNVSSRFFSRGSLRERRGGGDGRGLQTV